MSCDSRWLERTGMSVNNANKKNYIQKHDMKANEHEMMEDQ